MISATVEQSIGSKIEIEGGESIVGKWATFMLHAQTNGKFNGLRLSREVASGIIDLEIWVKEGKPVKEYLGSDDAIGSVLIRYHPDTEHLKLFSLMNSSASVSKEK